MTNENVSVWDYLTTSASWLFVP